MLSNLYSFAETEMTEPNAKGIKDKTEIAIKKAGERGEGSVAGSDAFFPFSDAVLALANAGVSVVVQPGGSMRDNEVTEACNANNICMIHTGTRHFKH